ncbi:Radical SAM superfamily protein [Poriferisphaera corsica]|uniref:Radical SAM superfamily protein n=1 Tax=Poriferisphaera corsica TaxID=2528020 RepID=A0A517YYN5_9BACT|nr:radical SAM protein [Poriferisphaera corsica]QDU35331.1 Radical SAM superfamily protein [Poriferisphaera corsica]
MSNPDNKTPDHHLDVVKRIFSDHSRSWDNFTYVYPVISRRSGGLSIGINLNVNNACNFDCIYCCVDRSQEPEVKKVDLTIVRAELDALLQEIINGNIWQHPKFKDVPQKLRRVNDIAFSGNGEPTTYNAFGEAIRLIIDLITKHKLDETKIVLITNATVLNRDSVIDAISEMMAHNGEIWAKLDAGTEAYYQLVDRTRVPFDRVLNNITAIAQRHPIVIQTMLMQVLNQPMPATEFDTYLDRLEDIIRADGQIKSVQLYSVARETAEDYVSPVTDQQLDDYAAKLLSRLPNTPVDVFYGIPND